jgi:hypothetical protein
MPIKIPIYEQRAGYDALPGVRRQNVDQTSEAQAQLGRAVGQIGETAGQGVALYERVRKSQNDAALDQAYTELSAAEQRLLEGEGGFLGQQGQNAIGGSVVVMQQYEREVDTIRKGLGNDPARKAGFKSLSDNRRIKFRSLVDRHVASESAAVEERNYKATLATSIDNATAAAARGDPGGAVDELFMGFARIDDKAGKDGWDKDARKRAMTEFTTDGYLNVLDSLVKGGMLPEAREMFALHKDEIDAVALQNSRIEERLAAGEVQDTAVRMADQIFHQSQGDLGAAGGLIREIDDPGLRDDVQRRIEHAIRVDQEVRRQRLLVALDKIHLRVLKDEVVTLNDDDVQQLPVEGQVQVAQWLAAEERESRPSSVAANRYQADVNRWAVNHARAKSLFEQAAMDPQGEEWRGYDGKAFPGKGTREAIAVIKRQATDKIRKLGEETVGEFDRQIQGDEVARSLKGESRRRYVAYMRAQYSDWAAGVEASTGARPSKKETDAWATQFYAREAALWGQGKTRGQVESRGGTFEPAASGSAPAPAAPVSSAVPEADRAMIVEAWRKKRGTDPSPAEIEETYRKHVEGR